MAKTRSQTGNIAIKKEEKEDCKDNLLSQSISDTTKKRAKITKRKVSKNKNKRLPAQQVKVEEDTDTKSLLQSSPKYSKLPKRRLITQEQINQLIDYIVNNKMSIMKAARKVKLSPSSAYAYYTIYKNDPEKKIPSPRTRQMHVTQEHIGHIVDDKMSIKEASAKANMSNRSGTYFYKKYVQNPNHSVPIQPSRQNYTQDQKNKLIGCIVNDKMSIAAASKKASMRRSAGYNYYHNYFDHRNPAPSHITIPKNYTQEQIRELIRCIVDDKMTIMAASRKVKMNQKTAGNYYRQYLKDNNMEIPVPKTNKRYTQDIIDELVGYIDNDKMTIKEASKKANMNYSTGQKYYRQYLKQRNPDMSTPKYIAQDRIDELIGYIVDDNMSIYAASKKANVAYQTGKKYYLQYLKNQNLDVPN